MSTQLEVTVPLVETIPLEPEFYSHPDCTIDDEMVAVNDQVQLRVITFTPPHPPEHPPVLFIPGWVSRMDSWGNALKALTADTVVYYVETREKTSSQLKGKYGLGVEDIAHDIICLTEILELPDNEYVLMGSSLGATAILEACTELRRSPGQVTLIGPNAVFRVPAWGRIVIRLFIPSLYLILKPWLKWYLRTFRVNVEADPEQYRKYCRNLDAADPYKLKKAALRFQDYTVWDILPDIEVPVLIISGNTDKLHEHGNVEKMAPLLPNCKLIDLGTNSRTHSAEMISEMWEHMDQTS